MDKVQSKLNKIKELLAENDKLINDRNRCYHNIYALENAKDGDKMFNLLLPGRIQGIKKFIANIEFQIAANNAEIEELVKECQEILN